MDQKELESKVREIRTKLENGESLSRTEEQIRAYHMNEGLCHACYGNVLKPIYNKRKTVILSEVFIISEDGASYDDD